uniref:Uncharacterized protein n=1 Tax=Timema bartmani TaxID=61472 RepID=A0A7R9I1F9_9NEOP|nr:unnamed protein product [Timema bartmani]
MNMVVFVVSKGPQLARKSATNFKANSFLTFHWLTGTRAKIFEYQYRLSPLSLHSRHCVLQTSFSVLLRSTTEELLKYFLDGIFPLPLSKLIQVSMDGPNVNLKFTTLLQEHIKSVTDNEIHTSHNKSQQKPSAERMESGFTTSIRKDCDGINIRRKVLYL